MRITDIPVNPSTYSSKVYLLRGDFNGLADLNTLIDSGGDDYIIHKIEEINTGLGKKKVSQIILTHNHFDHTIGARHYKEKYNDVKIYSYAETKITDYTLRNKQILKVADTLAEIIHSPFHSHDSICIYFHKEKILFSGDVQLVFYSKQANIEVAFIEFLELLVSLNIETIYPGHGNRIENANEVLRNSLRILTTNV